MRWIWIVAIVNVVVATIENNPAQQQIVDYANRTSGSFSIMTTSAGAPIHFSETATLNKPLIFNEYFMDSLTHLVRERIPQRLVHANGAGGFGYFEVTHDITNICKAKLFSQVGKRTPIAARFSTVVAGQDTARDARGFAVKFYTEDGNFDIAGFSTPMFVIKDPVLFPDLIRAQKPNPATNLNDANMLWDFLTLRPESLHIFTWVFGDRGIPDGYRHMPGYGIHTFQVYNEQGDKYFVRFHFNPDAGIKNLNSDQASKIADTGYATRDLYNAIGNGDFLSWSVQIQVLTSEDVKAAGFDVFDVTKVLPLNKYPLRMVGRMVLNRNPVNYFAEIEQLAFCPGNLVPGILGAPDKIFEARRLAYRSAQYHRLGGNFNKIKVNCPFQTVVHAYNRDGVPPVGDNERDAPNFYPNSFNGAVAHAEGKRPELIQIFQDEANNFHQVTDLYANQMTREERKRLVDNLISGLSSVTEPVQKRAVQFYTAIHHDFGSRLEKGLSRNRLNRYVLIY